MSNTSRRTFLTRAAALAAGGLALTTLGGTPGALAAGLIDCDMADARDTRPHKGFASTREGSGGQCTTHVARRFDTVAPEPGVNWSGGARLWLDRAAAAAAGWYTTPDIEAARPGLIAVWDNWDGVSEQRLFNGHVAFVEDREGDEVLLSEMNWGSTCLGPAPLAHLHVGPRRLPPLHPRRPRATRPAPLHRLHLPPPRRRLSSQ